MSHIFISYSSKDRALVDELAADIDLLLDNPSIWFDRELNRSGGHQWWSLICEQIRRCDIFIYALSPQVLKSEPCRREYSYAVALGKPVLPVMLADTEIRYLPVELQAAQIVNFRQRTRDQQRSLKLSLQNMPPAPPLPANDLELAPAAPLDPVGVLFDRINRLTNDPDQQRLIILDIEDLHEEEAFQSFVPHLLARLLDRDDVLTVRNLRRAEDLRVRVGAYGNALSFPGSSSHIEFPSTPSAATEPAPGTRMIDDKGIEMVYVPTGKFLMGSTEEQVDIAYAQAQKDHEGANYEWYKRELPQHEINIIEGFWLDLTPVTNESYDYFIKDGGYTSPKYWTKTGWAWLQQINKVVPKNFDNFTNPDQPRVGVTWFEVGAYCRWRGGKLPTEAEWEWAARGPKSLIYPWGNKFDAKRVVFRQTSGGKTAPVGSEMRLDGSSWIGALDMSGNVFEWVSTRYQPYPYLINDGRENLDDEVSYRIVRAGSWWSFETPLLRTSFRYPYPTQTALYDLGFRCLRPYAPS